MARTVIPVTDLVNGTFVAHPAGTAADQANDHYIAVTRPLNELMLHITQTAAAGGTATIVAGDNPPALSAGQGNLAQAMAQNEVWLITGLEGARYLQVGSATEDAGTLHINLDATFTGTIRAFWTSPA